VLLIANIIQIDGMKNATKPQRFTNRATSSKIMWTTSIITDDQSGEPTLGQ